jgi:3,4-dihydroxy 2-butanone 4-phosphate synthase/GTP cyclohydrolase II
MTNKSRRAKAVSVDFAITQFAAGNPVIVIGNYEGRWMAAMTAASALVTAKTLSLLAERAHAMLIVGLPADRLELLEIEVLDADPAVPERRWTASVDLRGKPGLTMSNQAATIRALCANETRPKDLVRPGFVHPIRVETWGVLARRVHLEAACDLAGLAGLMPSAVVSAVLAPDGSRADPQAVAEICAATRICAVNIDDIAQFRFRTSRLVEMSPATRLPVDGNDLLVHAFRYKLDDRLTLSLATGNVAGAQNVSVSVHRYSVVSHVFHSSACTCRTRLDETLGSISTDAPAVIVYLLEPDGAGMNLEHGPECPVRLTESETVVTAQVIRDLQPESIKFAGLRGGEIRELVKLLPTTTVLQ